MKAPNCECFAGDPVGSEQLIYDVAREIGQHLEDTCNQSGICKEAFEHLALTLITMTLRVSAGYKSGNVLNSDAEFETLLSTLVDDIKIRDMQLDAYVERDGRGGGLSS